MGKHIRKYPKVDIPAGLKISVEILKRLKKRKELFAYEIMVGCFTNCREVGLTFYPIYLNGRMLDESKTFCIYEHRNSDQIIINGKEGYITGSGELPYMSDSKWDYLASAECENYDVATDLLVREILKIKKVRE